MAFLTRAGIHRFRDDPISRILAEYTLRHTRAEAEASVFLSHSHADRDVIVPAVHYLATQGVSVYVDWRDPEMPAVTSPATARALQTRIRENRRFVLLATDRSLTSRWVPWELGYADAAKRPHDVAVLPVLERMGEAPAEYVGIYARIEITVEATYGTSWVYAPGQVTPACTLRDWLLAP